MTSKRLTRRFIATKAKMEKREDIIKRKRRQPLPVISKARSFHQILRLFFQPILALQSLDMLDHNEKLDLLFAPNHRQIITFTCLTAFNMPGFVPHQERSEYVKFAIRPGDLLWVRIDIRTPNMVDVESLKNNCTYRLTSSQYAYILQHIERITPICNMNNSSD